MCNRKLDSCLSVIFPVKESLSQRGTGSVRAMNLHTGLPALCSARRSLSFFTFFSFFFSCLFVVVVVFVVAYHGLCELDTSGVVLEMVD